MTNLIPGGLNVASLALIAVVSAHLGRSAITEWPTAAVFLLIAFRINPTWLIAAGALAGLLLS